MTNQATMTEDMSRNSNLFEPAPRFFENHQPHHSIPQYNGEYMYPQPVYHPYPPFQMPMAMPIQFSSSMQNPTPVPMHIGRLQSMPIPAPQLNHSQLTETSSSTTGSPNSNGAFISASEDSKETDRKPKKKPGVPVPEEKKDDAYRAKRMKNNESAKRSRETRRLRSASVEAEITEYRRRIAEAKERISNLTIQRAQLENQLHGMAMNQGRQV